MADSIGIDSLLGKGTMPAAYSADIRGRVIASVESGSSRRYLPKYSPDLNPIEMPFSKLKAYLRKAAERAIPRLRRRIGRFARTLTTREASNYFRHAGYA
jgi:transposase